MKLKCKDHDRRVLIIQEKEVPLDVLLHRNDGTRCDSKYVVMGEKLIMYQLGIILGVDPDHMLRGADRKEPDDSILLTRKEIIEVGKSARKANN